MEKQKQQIVKKETTRTRKWCRVIIREVMKLLECNYLHLIIKISIILVYSYLFPIQIYNL